MEENIIDGVPEERVWREYCKNRDINTRDKIINQYVPLVKYVAGKVSIGLPSSVSFNDLVSFGTFGLLDAIEKFDPDKHVKFKTYAVTRIRGAIFDELRAIDWIPRSVRQKSREIDEQVQYLELRYGRPPTDEEIARSLNMSQEEFGQTMLKLSSTSLLSLNDMLSISDDESLPRIETVRSPLKYQPEAIVERQEIRQVIVDAINELPKKEKMILVFYYYEDLTLKEIGALLKVTESRISQLHTRAVLRLRNILTNSRKGISDD